MLIEHFLLGGGVRLDVLTASPDEGLCEREKKQKDNIHDGA